MAIVTKTSVKAYLDISGSSLDSFITDAISKIEADIKAFCGQEIEETTVDYVMRGNGKSLMLLKNDPVTTINNLYYRDKPTDVWTEETDSTKFSLTIPDGIYSIYYNDGFTQSREYKVNYTYGYSTVPEDVKKVAIEMTSDYLLNSYATDLSEAQRHGIRQKATGFSGDTQTTTYELSNYARQLGKYVSVV